MRIKLLTVVIFFIMLSGCVSPADLKIGALAQSRQDKEMMKYIEGFIKGDGAAATKHLLFLCGAYYNLKMYNICFNRLLPAKLDAFKLTVS